MDLFNTTKKILNNTVDINEGLVLFDTERCLLLLMVHENYPAIIKDRISSKEEKIDLMSNIIEIYVVQIH